MAVSSGVFALQTPTTLQNFPALRERGGRTAKGKESKVQLVFCACRDVVLSDWSGAIACISPPSVCLCVQASEFCQMTAALLSVQARPVLLRCVGQTVYHTPLAKRLGSCTSDSKHSRTHTQPHTHFVSGPCLNTHAWISWSCHISFMVRVFYMLSDFFGIFCSFYSVQFSCASLHISSCILFNQPSPVTWVLPRLLSIHTSATSSPLALPFIQCFSSFLKPISHYNHYPQCNISTECHHWRRFIRFHGASSGATKAFTPLSIFRM